MKSRQTFSRNRRLEGEMRAVLAELLRLSVKDPRLEGVTVSAIQLSADRTQASVFYSVIGDDERERQAADGFAAAAAFLRRELGHRMRLRTVPAAALFSIPTALVRVPDGHSRLAHPPKRPRDTR